MGSSITSSINQWGFGFLGYIIPFLFVLTIVVFFHELGHFLVARLYRIKVLVFSLGFGPELLGTTIAPARAGSSRRFPSAAMSSSSATRTRRACPTRTPSLN